ncbi:MAG: hypothetical protein WDK96_03335 [Candidatus Paceibacterota bacterium]|jgi:hypothetical protein
MNNIIENKKQIIIALVAIIVLLFVFYGIKQISNNEGTGGKNYKEFAQCLASKNVTMYGAYWCSHCLKQKKAFGKAFQYVPYVECTKEIDKCETNSIKSYPTWIFGDGKRSEGETSFEKLAELSGCLLP